MPSSKPIIINIEETKSKTNNREKKGGIFEGYSNKMLVRQAAKYICPSPPRLKRPHFNAKQTPTLANSSKPILSNMLPKCQKDEVFIVKKTFKAFNGVFE